MNLKATHKKKSLPLGLQGRFIFPVFSNIQIICPYTYDEIRLEHTFRYVSRQKDPPLTPQCPNFHPHKIFPNPHKSESLHSPEADSVRKKKN